MKKVFNYILLCLIILSLVAVFVRVASIKKCSDSGNNSGNTDINIPGNNPGTPSGGGTSGGNNPDTPSGGGTTNYPVGTVLLNGKELANNSKNITFKSGDEITLCGISDYSVSVYAYCKDEKTDFCVAVNDSSIIHDWSDYQSSVDPFTGVAEKDFLKYEKSGLTLNKTANGFSLSYDNFSDFIGADVYWLPVTAGLNIEDIYICDKFRTEIAWGDTVFNFYFNIVDDWVKLCTYPKI